MAEPNLTPLARKPILKDMGIAVLLVATILALLFTKSFDPNYVLFSNDAPLGLVMAESGQVANNFDGGRIGYWQDLNWLGVEQPVFPNLSFGMYQLYRDPVLNAKLYGPLSLLFLGFCAWVFFRQLGFRNTVCVLGAIAAALNMNTFSHVCWGLPSRALSQASIFLALAALQSGSVRWLWLKAMLAGMAVGMAVMEGFDVGALYSVYVAAFAFFIAWNRGGLPGKKLAGGVALVMVVALAAGWLSAHALNTLIGTQIKGVAGMAQDEATRQQRWDQATMWSLPKQETLRVLIPGLFGYRMDTPEGGWYWGAVGQQPGVPQSRHSGAGEYAGCLVILVAVWACASAFRRKDGPFTDLERKHILFWSAAAVLSLLLAWGRHAPFYQVIYALPYFSTIRNPIKFMHMFHLSVLTLFAFGLEGMFRLYVTEASSAKEGISDHLKDWWRRVSGLDRKYVIWTACLAGASILGFLIFLSSGRELAAYLRAGGFAEDQVQQISKFSRKEVLLYLVFYLFSLGSIVLLLSGWLAGARWKMAVLLLGGILTVDLARANQPWIVYYNYKERYSNSPLYDLLKKDAYEKRVTFKLAPFSANYLVDMSQLSWFAQLSHNWLQNQFQSFNIHALEVAQMPRIPELDLAFLQAMSPRQENEAHVIPRLFQLTSTRWLIGQHAYLEILNRQLLPGQNKFRLVTGFNVVPKSSQPDKGSFNDDEVTTQFSPQGTFAVMEYVDALPRVALFTNWLVAEDKQSLELLRSASFNPLETVLVSESIPGPATNIVSTNRAAARFEKYGPKRFEVRTESDLPSVLLVTDKFSPNWKAWVDGQPATILRANYLMRGVHLPPGNHTVTFRFVPPAGSLYVTLSAMLGAGIIGIGLALQWYRTPKEKAA